MQSTFLFSRPVKRIIHATLLKNRFKKRFREKSKTALKIRNLISVAIDLSATGDVYGDLLDDQQNAN